MDEQTRDEAARSPLYDQMQPSCGQDSEGGLAAEINKHAAVLDEGSIADPRPWHVVAGLVAGLVCGRPQEANGQRQLRAGPLEYRA